ncbi:MAG: secF [Alphaproteobacteria bacterium]|nr:secF [Alphaproteobacteria bacterium]
MPLLKLVPDNTNLDFMRWRNVALTLSLIVTIGSIILVLVRGLNLGVDFVGGQMIRATFTQAAPIEDVRARIAALGVGDANIQEFGDPKTLSIRMGLPQGGEEAANAVGSRIRTTISQKYPDAVFAVDTVSGKVSSELYRSGALAIALSMLGIAIYIWFRFEWQFGVGALTTLFHDVSVTMGFFALTQLEFNLNVVAAILTIVGYSLNDTVVIYDRIRENLRKYRKMETIPLLNLSLNETLSRTIVTSLSIMIALLTLLLLGPEVIFGLTIAILLGIFVGTYSSIYISAPILVWLKVGPDSFLSRSANVGERVTSQNEGY